MAENRYTPELLWRALRHCWFPVARSEDIATPQSATLLDQRLAVFRDRHGTARVTDSRCPHRGADLSMGTVVDGGIECPYHGWVFDGADGRCARLPSLADQDRIPPKAAVRTYPVVERFQHVWTCLDEPLLPLPEPPELDNLTLDWRAGKAISAECGFMAATENFRDMAHFPFVHRRSMGDVDPVFPKLDVERDGREVRASFFYRKNPGSSYSDMGDCWMHYHTYAPGLSGILFDYGATGKRYLMDFPAPATPESCTIFWAAATDADFTGGTVEEITDLETGVFDEDTPILNRLRPREIQLLGDTSEVSCPADVYTLNYRRATMTAVDLIVDKLGGVADDPAPALTNQGR